MRLLIIGVLFILPRIYKYLQMANLFTLCIILVFKVLEKYVKVMLYFVLVERMYCHREVYTWYRLYYVIDHNTIVIHDTSDMVWFGIRIVTS